MMKRYLFALLALVAVMTVQADTVSQERALAVAQGFLNNGGATFKAGAAPKLAHKALSADGLPDYYVFNYGADGGFVVVSGDDRTVPVWGYSTSGMFDYETMPENVRCWFEYYQSQMQYLREHPNVQTRQPVTLASSVGPLLSTRWDQTYPYNLYCPTAYDYSDLVEYNDHACTGCVATALAQIMNYHKWPKVGAGSQSYDVVVKGFKSHGSHEEQDRNVTLTADFSKSEYKWSLMKDEYGAYWNTDGSVCMRCRNGNGNWVEYGNVGPWDYSPFYAVARLMKDAGYAVEMKYGSPHRGGSSSNIEKAKSAMENNFSYQAEVVSPSTYDVDWDLLLRTELAAGKPIYYRADNANGVGDGGHAFVVEGFDTDGYFYFNWGWGGDYNGPYLTSLLNPGVYDFKYGHRALFLTPKNGNYPIGGQTVKSLSVAMESGNAGKINKSGIIASLPFTVYGVNLDHEVRFTLSGPNADQFTLAGHNSVSAAEANNGFTYHVHYRPTTVGTHTAKLTFTSGDDVEPVTLNLKGEATLYYDNNGDGIINISDLTGVINSVLSDGTLGYSDKPASITDVTQMIGAVLSGETDVDVSEGMVLYYPFNGDALDESGHGNDGMVNNLRLTTGVTGDENGAYAFGGTSNSGYIQVPASSSMSFTDSFTFACFVKPMSWAGMDGDGDGVASQCLFAMPNENNGPVLLSENDGSGMRVGLSSFQSQWDGLSSGSRIKGDKLDEWVHIAVVVTNGEQRLYIDGAPISTKTGTTNVSSLNGKDLYLGAFYHAGTCWYPLNGVLDEVRVYNRALSPVEVTVLAECSERGYEETHPFTLSQGRVKLAVGENVTIEMLNGGGSYGVGVDPALLDLTLDSEQESFTLKGLAPGMTHVIVNDVTSQTQISLPVTVTVPTEPKTETFTVNGVTFKMVGVEGGTFMMGAADDDQEASDREKPAHRVTLSSYSIGETEVTQALWVAVMGSNPSVFKGNLNHPVEYITWDKCQEFITKLNQMTGRNFRLPTEAEFEFAARGGNKSLGYKYSGSNNINDVAWWGYFDGGNSGWCSHPVAQLLPNELGLYDMSGNVYEWCQDWHGNYTSDDQVNPTGPESGSVHSYRGGCWYSGTRGCRVSYRTSDRPSIWDGTVGLRLAMSEVIEPEMQNVYTCHVKVTVNGYNNDNQDDIKVEVSKKNGMYDLILRNFVLIVDGISMPVGSIKLVGVNGVDEDDYTTINYIGSIIITPGSLPEYNESDWMGPLLGDVPIDLTVSFNNTNIIANIDINMEEILSQVINGSISGQNEQLSDDNQD